jgi:glycosyltransferase involved in cell wall biosynthesis
MKVIFVTREGYRLPGARVRCYNFASCLSELGVETEVLSFSDTLGAKDGENERLLSVKDKLRYNLAAFKKLRKERDAILCMQRFNYHSLAPYLAHSLCGNKLILDLDDWEIRENPRYYFGFFPASKAHYFTRRIARKSVFCIAASRFLESVLRGFNPRTYYIPTGVDTRLFKPGISHPDQDRVIFSWIGTFHRPEYVENIAFLLDCFRRLHKRLPNVTLEICGDGIYKGEIGKMIAGAGGNVALKGWIEPGQVPGYLDTIDIGLLPVARETKFNLAKSPTKLFEYMAMGKPAVATSVGEASCVLAGENAGFLASSSDEFVDKMETLAKDPVLRSGMGKLGRTIVEEEYSLGKMASRFYDALTESSK